MYSIIQYLVYMYNMHNTDIDHRAPIIEGTRVKCQEPKAFFRTELKRFGSVQRPSLIIDGLGFLWAS